MKCVTLVPWRAGGDNRRLQLWDWTRPFLEQIGWPIFTGDAPGEVFSRAAAINAAARAAGHWDVALIGDADTVQDPGAAHAAAELAPHAGLVTPWTHRIKLSAEGSEKLARAGTGAVTEWDRDKQDGTRPWGGGATIVIARTAFEEVGGFDELFLDYGNEDLAFVAAVTTLVGPAARVAGLVWHLHHRPQPRVGTKFAATPANQARWDRYKAARGNPEEMRALLDERTERMSG